MGKWEMVRLGGHIKQIRGVSYKPEDTSDVEDGRHLPLLRAHNIQAGRLNANNLVFVSKDKIKDYQLLKNGDIVVCASSGSKDLVGKAAQATENMNVAFGAFCKVVRPKNGINAAYLKHYFSSPRYRYVISGLSAGANINNLRNEHIDDLRIPFPPLDIQRQIADVLDRASALIEKRKVQIDKLDLLVKSQFIEMFGDPVSNPRGWEIGTIRDLVSEVKYGTSKPAVDNGKYIYLRMNNITYSGLMDYTDLKYIDIDDREIKKYVVRKGDILFNRTNSKELVGKTAVFKEDTPMIIAGYIIRIRANRRSNPEYISGFLNSGYGKQTLQDMCKAIIGQANINAQELQSIQIPMTPIDLQNQFADFVQQVEARKSLLQQSLAKLELNYKSLMQKCFRGEIF